MKANVGSVDKAIRIIIALVLFSLYFFLEGNLRYIALIGLIPLLTAFMSWCPLCSLFGMSTCRFKKS